MCGRLLSWSGRATVSSRDGSSGGTGGGWLGMLLRLVRAKGDPNDVRTDGKEGIWYAPLSTAGHRRVGARERVLEVATRQPKRLTVELDALATQVLFDGERG